MKNENKPDQIFFLHIGKTGGTAMNLVLQEHARHIKRCKHSIGLQDVPVGAKCFFILRDPLTRFVSAFYSRQREGLPRYYSPRNESEVELFDTFSTPNELACALGDSSSRNHALAVHSMGVIGHFHSYFKWFKSKNYVLSRRDDILMCCFTETLDEDFEKLRPLLGIPDNVYLPTDEYFAHKTPGGYDTTLSEEACRALSEFYKDDIEFVGFCRTLFA